MLDVDVDIETEFVESESQPDDRRYVFAYTVTVHNQSEVPATLMERRWTITHGTGKVERVEGEGVVGQQPRLLPGQGFRYTSGAVLESDVGIMEGRYILETDEGSRYEASIPAFTLAVPRTLH